jgi:hypothetical protein
VGKVAKKAPALEKKLADGTQGVSFFSSGAA